MVMSTRLVTNFWQNAINVVNFWVATTFQVAKWTEWALLV
jgi:hypothetical protein